MQPQEAIERGIMDQTYYEAANADDYKQRKKYQRQHVAQVLNRRLDPHYRRDWDDLAQRHLVSGQRLQSDAFMSLNERLSRRPRPNEIDENILSPNDRPPIHSRTNSRSSTTSSGSLLENSLVSISRIMRSTLTKLKKDNSLDCDLSLIRRQMDEATRIHDEKMNSLKIQRTQCEDRMEQLRREIEELTNSYTQLQAAGERENKNFDRCARLEADISSEVRRNLRLLEKRWRDWGWDEIYRWMSHICEGRFAESVGYVRHHVNDYGVGVEEFFSWDREAFIDIAAMISSEADELLTEIERLMSNRTVKRSSSKKKLFTSPIAAPLSTFLCPITNDVMRDPVRAADGYVYERSAIEDWFTKSDRSPTTNQLLRNFQLTPDVALKALIASWDEPVMRMGRKDQYDDS